MDINRCLQAFGTQTNDQLIVVKEQHLAESNFVISYLLKQIISNSNDNRIVLILTHNTLGHYECVGKRLGYNLTTKISENVVRVIDVQELILSSIEKEFNVHCIFNEVQTLLSTYVTELKEQLSSNGKLYVFVDDFTHLHDCILDVGKSVNFLNSLLGRHYSDNVGFIVGMHMGNMDDKILSSDLEYSADCIIDVSLMKTGRSDDVSGVMKVVRNRKLATYHYKVKEYGIDMYKPGEILMR